MMERGKSIQIKITHCAFLHVSFKYNIQSEGEALTFDILLKLCNPQENQVTP